MENNEKFLIQRKTRLRYQRLRLITGFCSLFTNLKKSLIASAYIVFACIFWTYKATFIYMNNTDMFGFANKFMVELIFPFILIGGFLALLVLLGTPFGAKEINERLLRTGLINHAGETPLLINKSFDRKTGVTIMEFESNGIPLYAWEDSKENIEAILNVNIVEIRQDRAFGIHLILATQRPDANILTGQIRNNIDFRVCGRADNVLSQIILDSTDAAEQIPKYEQGLFVTNTGKTFRGYLFDENSL